MPEGSLILVFLAVAVLSGVGFALYCFRLAGKYKRIEADRYCIYRGVRYHVVSIVYERNDWFMRRVRLHTDTYPYVVEIPIAEVQVDE